MSTPRFQFIKNLSIGGFGTTFLINDKLINEKCIIKFIPIDKFHENEIQIMKKIHNNGCNPNLICLRDYFVYKNNIAIVSDYIVGDTLWNTLRINKTEFNLNVFIWIFKKLIDSLNYMHNVLNIAHLDIKPENIIISFDSDSYNVSIIDFGSCCMVINNNTCKTISYTKGYISPSYIDIVKDKKSKFDLQYAKSIDIFSLGITIYYLLFLGKPYQNIEDNKVDVLNKTKEILIELNKENNIILLDRLKTIYPHIDQEESINTIKIFKNFLIHMLNPNDNERITINKLSESINKLLDEYPIFKGQIEVNDNKIKEYLTKINFKYYQVRNAIQDKMLYNYTADKINKEVLELTKKIVSSDYGDILSKSGFDSIE